MADIKVFKNFAQYKNFTEEELNTLVAGCAEKTFKHGSLVIEEGKVEDSSAYFIKSGSLKVVKISEGSEILLGFLNQGDFLGEMALLVPGPRSVSVLAVNDVTLFELSKTNFEKWKQSCPSLVFKLMHLFIKSIIYRLRVTNRRLFTEEEELIG